MKLYLAAILVIASLISIFLLVIQRYKAFPDKSASSPSATPQPSDSISSGTAISVTVDEESYLIHTRVVPASDRMALIANFTRRETGERLVQEHKCLAAINGGFYTKEGNPLGWFISEGSQAGQLIESNLATGFFWQDTDGNRHISRTAPHKGDVDFVLQTGPYIDVGSRKLQLVSDEPARRSLLGLTDQNQLVMIAVTEKDNIFNGPLLADIPLFFTDPKVQQRIRLRTLLNLDGGSASFFYSKEHGQSFLLSELTPIGSLICIR